MFQSEITSDQCLSHLPHLTEEFTAVAVAAVVVCNMKITFLHPDLGIGGAERLVVDAAVALCGKGHRVTVMTGHHDRQHCFDGQFCLTVKRVFLFKK